MVEVRVAVVNGFDLVPLSSQVGRHSGQFSEPVYVVLQSWEAYETARPEYQMLHEVFREDEVRKG
jgi:hypothetical protein